MNSVRIAGAAFALGLMTLVAGCDRSDAAAPARDHSGSSGYAPAAAAPHAPAPMLNGKPIWADNRQHSAQENVDYQFGHWGQALGARDARDYALKARAFIEHPPRGAEKVTRPNGDVMLYDKGSNTFAIVRKDGAPRLFRKSPGGAADWAKAKSEASDTGYKSRRRSGSSGRDFRGGGSDD